MPHSQRTVLIDRAASAVFAFFADSEKDPQWCEHVKEIQRSDLSVLE
jgi:uncharacterized membrane protein